jgi:sortase A
MLDNLVTGDEIIVYYNQKKYTYVINEKKVIKPGNLKILERDPTKKELSLMTCWPIGTSLNRLITFAELKSVN